MDNVKKVRMTTTPFLGPETSVCLYPKLGPDECNR